MNFPRLHWPLILCLILPALGLAWCAPLPQDPAYHAFADRRCLCGVNNCADTLSNLPFVIFGLWGLFLSWRLKLSPGSGLPLFFLGIFLTGFGSAWYHLAPSNTSLVWDRLPMTLAFAGCAAAICGERLGRETAWLVQGVLVPLGIVSVLWWNWTESQGAGDLRLYAWCQFGTLPALVWLLARAKGPQGRQRMWIEVFACYAAAKILEAADHEVFELTRQVVSGHTLKHLAAAAAAGCVIRGLHRSINKD
ncbi:MAG: hypothetical protein RL095_2702 [Verrucomicrobiota bacterium]|jgi:hypothetical protein